MKFLILGILFCYGLFSRFTNSEFWPITISKTWLTPSEFEHSMVQKPLLTLILSLFHLLPFSDQSHLLAVKTIFALIGLLGMYLYTRFVCNRFLTGHNLNPNLLFAGALTITLLLSPNYQNNFFAVRSDQLAFTFFTLFLNLTEAKRPTAALISLFLIPAAGVKESFFLIAGLIYFFFDRKLTLDRKMLFFIGYAGLAAAVWIVALNIPYFHYFTDIYSSDEFSPLANFQSLALKAELPALIVSVFANLYIFFTRRREYYKLSLISLFLTLVIVVNPQPFFFFLAGVCPLIYLSLWAAGKDLLRAPKLFYSGAALAVAALSLRLWLSLPFFAPIMPQLKFIEKVSKTIERNHLSYLDGAGILPRQKFISCFASPGDEVANESCIDSISAGRADVVIVTNRLNFIGARIFSALPKDYEQIYPNTWIRSAKLTEEIKKNADLSEQVGIPILLF